MKQWIFILVSTVLFASLLLSQSKAESKPSYKEMTLYDFMEDYTEVASKQAKKGQPENLKKILDVMPNMAIDSEKEDWKRIVEEYQASGELQKSCKACHSKYKRSYKKTYRKRLIQVPIEVYKLYQN